MVVIDTGTKRSVYVPAWTGTSRGFLAFPRSGETSTTETNRDFSALITLLSSSEKQQKESLILT